MIEGQNLDQAKRHPDVVKNIIKKDGRKDAVPYTPSNPPPYPVTSVNGQTGDIDIPTVDLPVPVQNGGTGADNAADARTNLGLGNAAIENVVPLNKGGTGATTAAQAAKNLNVLPLGEVTTKIPSGANLNDYVLPGVYAISGSNVAATIANLPIKLAGIVRVFASAGAAITASSTWKYLIQEYITYTGVMYQRYGESGSSTAVTWGTWKTIYISSDFPFQIDKNGKTLDITSDWFISRGTDGHIPTLRTGYIDSGSSLDVTTSTAFIVLSYSSNHCAIYNCLGSSITRIAGTATSSVETAGGGYRITNTGSGTLRYFILTLL